MMSYDVTCVRDCSNTVDGRLYMWGWGGRGQLGQGEILKSPQNLPLLVEGFK